MPKASFQADYDQLSWRTPPVIRHFLWFMPGVGGMLPEKARQALQRLQEDVEDHFETYVHGGLYISMGYENETCPCAVLRSMEQAFVAWLSSSTNLALAMSSATSGVRV